MDILVLGGTGPLGRKISAGALARGHKVTCVARGNGPTIDGATLVLADRDEDHALAPVSGRDWDAVVDLTRHPLHARRAVRDLRARHWLYVSSASVYLRGDVPEQDESGATADPLQHDFLTDPSDYGAAKVACENVYHDRSPSHTIIRAGLIGGDEDDTGRSGYYPWRFAHPTGENVLVPDPTFPIAMIDAEDLAAWIIHCAGADVCGTFNATGRTTTLSEVVSLSQEITSSTAVPHVVSAEQLDAFGVSAWMGPRSLPLWIDLPEFRYVATLDSSAARAQGLRLRPLRETLRAALQYEETRKGPLSGLSDDEERELRQRLQRGS